MTLKTRLATATTLLLAVVALPLPVRADPITVTGGTVEVAVGIHSARITFIGDGFMVATGTEDFFAAIADFPFPEGSSVSLGGVWRPTDMRGGEGTFNGVHYPELYFGILQSGGTFVTPSVMLTGQGAHTVTAPFTFSGFVTAFATPEPGPDDVPVFTTTLVGSGTARAAFFGMPPDGSQNPTALPGTGTDFELEYVFSPSPVPEPGTWVLLGTGVLGIAAARYRSRLKTSRLGGPW